MIIRVPCKYLVALGPALSAKKRSDSLKTICIPPAGVSPPWLATRLGLVSFPLRRQFDCGQTFRPKKASHMLLSQYAPTALTFSVYLFRRLVV